MPNISMEQLEPIVGQSFQKSLNFSVYDNSDYLDISRVSPMQMMNNLAHMKSTIDPATIPIQSHECTVLVRALHQISCVLNEKVHSKFFPKIFETTFFSNNFQFGVLFDKSWRRPGFVGKVSRQLLYPPMIAQWFDKPRGW